MPKRIPEFKGKHIIREIPMRGKRGKNKKP